MHMIAAMSLIAAAFSTPVHGPARAQETNQRFCLIPIKNGESTAADHGDTWRMVSRVVMLPGIARPIIYPGFRGGVWTVDETDTFVRFGEDFPQNSLFDRYAIDPQTGLVAAASAQRGLFYIRPGQKTFTRVASIKGGPFKAPHAITFVERWKRFVISDTSGLYLWNADSSVPQLITSTPEIETPSSAFDLPSMKALLVSAKDRNVILRWDDGRTETITKTINGDFVVAVEETTKGIDIWTNRETLSFRKNQSGQLEMIWRVAGGRPISNPFEPREYPQTTHPARNPATGRRIFYDSAGIFEDLDTGDRTALGVPFDPRVEHVVGTMEMPASRATIVFTTNKAYALQHDGKIEEVTGSQYLTDTRLSPQRGVIPVRKEMFVVGPRALYLLADTQVSGKSRCKGQL